MKKRWKDLSIRKRLLLSNYLMILAPILCFAVLSIGIFWAFGMENLNRANVLSFIWPESGPTLNIQFELTRLRVRSDQYNGRDLGHLLLVCDHLEDQGMQVALLQQGKTLYVTPGTSPDALLQEAQQRAPEGRGAIAWGEKGLAFHYTSPKGLEAVVVGADPLVEKSDLFQMTSKELFKSSFVGAFLLVLLMAALIGLAVSRIMAQQFLKPLGRLRRTAAQVSRGDLDTPIVADSQDEIGAVLRAFEKTRLELKANREKRQLYEQNRKEMMAGIVHDLATPLTKIQGYASGFKEGIANTPEKQQHYLEKILTATESMSRLNQTLLLLSKLDLDQVPFHWQTVNLSAFMEDCLAEQEEYWEKQGLTLSFASTLAAAPVALDPEQFQRVLSNVLGNSVKYRGQDGRVEIRLEPGKPGYVRLSFGDQGQGVTQDQLNKIFDSFYRTDRARTHVASGSGLGLAVVKKIVETMGGTIWAEANTPQGLKICMEFPLKEQQHGKDSHH